MVGDRQHILLPAAGVGFPDGLLEILEVLMFLILPPEGRMEALTGPFGLVTETGCLGAVQGLLFHQDSPAFAALVPLVEFENRGADCG